MYVCVCVGGGGEGPGGVHRDEAYGPCPARLARLSCLVVCREGGPFGLEGEGFLGL